MGFIIIILVCLFCAIPSIFEAIKFEISPSSTIYEYKITMRCYETHKPSVNGLTSKLLGAGTQNINDHHVDIDLIIPEDQYMKGESKIGIELNPLDEIGSVHWTIYPIIQHYLSTSKLREINGIILSVTDTKLVNVSIENNNESDYEIVTFYCYEKNGGKKTMIIFGSGIRFKKYGPKPLTIAVNNMENAGKCGNDEVMADVSFEGKMAKHTFKVAEFLRMIEGNPLDETSITSTSI